MDIRKASKFVGRNATQFSLSAVSSAHINNSLPQFNNPNLNLLVKAVGFIGSWAVVGTAMEPVGRYIDMQVDSIADAIAESK